MVGQSPSRRRAPSPAFPFSIDVAILMPRRGRLGVLCHRRAAGPVALPWDGSRPGESLEAAALRVARSAAGAEPAWLEQVGAFSDGTAHPGGSPLSVAWVAALPARDAMPAATGWTELRRAAAGLGARQRHILEAALAAVRQRMDRSPVAFRLLAPRFTLTELQQVYELLLGRPLHKASFRRALHAAWLVEPVDAWRSEGRGRPAQLFRFAPRKGRGGRRGVRFDLS